MTRLCAPVILALGLITVSLPVASALAAETSGGVFWVDTLGYTKPRFVPLAVPDEATVSDKYYVNFTTGSGTSCTQGAPCKDISAVAGKPGTTGGPAYVYLKGSGRLNLTGTLFGSPGKEIVIKPWPGDTSLVTMQTTGGGTVTSANIVKSGSVHDVIIDGGPNMQFDFVGAPSTGDQNAYTLVISSNFVTVARSRIRAAGGYGPALGVAIGSGTYSNIRIVNNEIYDANKPGAPYGVYTGGGTGCTAGDTAHTNVYFLNNIIRNICGRGIQIEPRNFGRFTYVEGNAFHDTGTNSCGFGQVSDAVQPADSCGGSISDLYVRNNIMFSLGGGGVGLVGSVTNAFVQNNTIYDYAKAAPLSTSSHGISCYADGCPGTIQNNVILHTTASGINPLNRASGLAASSNLCEPGKACGNLSKTGTRDSVFISYDPDSVDFLRLKSGSAAIGGGSNLHSAGLTGDYFGGSRPSNTSFDLGAIQSTSAVPSVPVGPLRAPTNLRFVQ
jgi:hypothetical protein